MLHVLLLYIGSEWPFRYITSNQNAKTDPKICLLHISPLPIPYILFLLSRTSPTTHLFPSPSPCFFSPLHHFTSSVSHSSSRVGFISSNKCPFFFSSPLPPSLPSISSRLMRQVARTASPGSVTKSAMTEGKRDSTTGTFPGRLLIRGAAHAL